MPKVKKEVKPIELRIPSPHPDIDNWIVLGLDRSRSRSGFAVMGVYPNPATGDLKYDWLGIGSAKPDKIEDITRHSRTTVWIRSKAIALFLREFLKLTPVDKPDRNEMHACTTENCCKPRTGLIISMEYPTPMNDFLVALNRILHVIFFEDGSLAEMFGEIRILTTNASTLRSLMGLKQRGAKNKVEHIEKAYKFVDKKVYPELDTDSCDAVLMAMMGRYAAAIMLGKSGQVPPAFLTSLCNATEEIKGKGKNAKKIIKGTMHRTEYWYTYIKSNYTILIKDASVSTKKLLHKGFTI